MLEPPRVPSVMLGFVARRCQMATLTTASVAAGSIARAVREGPAMATAGGLDEV